MDKGTEEKDFAEIDLKRRLDGRAQFVSLFQTTLRSRLSSHDHFTAWRNPLYDILAITDKIKKPSMEVETTKFFSEYLITMFNFMEATVYIQQDLSENLEKAASAGTQEEFRQILQKIQEDSKTIKTITPEDVKNLKWVSKFIKSQSEVDSP